MPKINTHYVSGPMDALVYDAADTAGLPELVSAGFDGEARVWRWDVTPAGSQDVRDVLLRVVVPAPGHVTVEITIVFTPTQLSKQLRSRLVAALHLNDPLAIDQEWLAINLSMALEAARQP